jgi:hypothetical protein
MWNARGMTALGDLAQVFGSWDGTNGFRLMPTDGLALAPATAAVAGAAGGHVVTVEYTWSHPDDGPQQGFLAVGHDDDHQAATALWSDSWHQPSARAIAATHAAEELSFEYQYEGGWRWQIVVIPGSDQLSLRMFNVVPDAEHGGHGSGVRYEAMVMDLPRRR